MKKKILLFENVFEFRPTWISREREKNTEYHRFHGDGPNCKIPTKNQPMRMPHLACELFAI